MWQTGFNFVFLIVAIVFLRIHQRSIENTSEFQYLSSGRKQRKALVLLVIFFPTHGLRGVGALNLTDGAMSSRFAFQRICFKAPSSEAAPGEGLSKRPQSVVAVHGN